MSDEAEKAAREKLAKATEERTAQEAAMQARAKWKPTPTPEECDLVAMGVPIDKVGRQDDGSGPDPHATRAMRPARQPPGGGYQTR